MKKTLMEFVGEIIEENNQLRELYKDYKGISEQELENELQELPDLDDINLFDDDDELVYAQVFWKVGSNNEGYYTKSQLQDDNIKHYTIIEKIK